MNTVLYYFSGTGNSLAVARELAKQLGNTSIVPVVAAIRGENFVPAERVGLVFPVYMWGLPLIIASFIDKLRLQPRTYYFAVATCGGMPGATLAQASRLFRKRGAELSAGFVIKMPGNYTPMYGAISEAKQKKLFEQAKEKVRKIAGLVRVSEKHKPETSMFLVNWIFSGLFYPFASPRIPEMDRDFYTDEKCTSCGICERVCPVGNIKLRDGKPTWNHACEQCLACLQWCMVESIQFGKMTAGRRRYRHPETRTDDFIFGK